jgi:hypothetical protein
MTMKTNIHLSLRQPAYAASAEPWQRTLVETSPFANDQALARRLAG